MVKLLATPRLNGLFPLYGFISLMVLATHALSYKFSDIGSSNPYPGVWFLLVSYHVLVLLPVYLWARYMGPRNKDSIHRLMEASWSLMLPLTVISIVGLTAHWYAKLSLLPETGYECLSLVRTNWLNHDRELLSTPVRVASMFGHSLSSFIFPGLFISAYHSVLKKRALFFLGFFALAGVAYALPIVSRTILLSLVIMGFMGGVLAIYSSQTRVFQKALRFGLIIGGIVLAAFLLSKAVFDNTLACGGGNGQIQNVSITRASVVKYEKGFLDELPVQHLAPEKAQEKVLNACPSCNMVFLYLNHGIFNFESILASEQRGTPVMLASVRYWLTRLGFDLAEEPPVRVYGRGGLTLPGAAWHDWGPMGMIVVALLHGGIAVISAFLFTRGLLSAAFGLVLFVIPGLLSAFSLLFPATSTIGFPFIVFSMFVTSLMALAVAVKRRAIS